VKLLQECKVSPSMLEAVQLHKLVSIPYKDLWFFFSNNPEFRSVCVALNGYFGLFLQV